MPAWCRLYSKRGGSFNELALAIFLAYKLIKNQCTVNARVGWNMSGKPLDMLKLLIRIQSFLHFQCQRVYMGICSMKQPT